MKALSPVRDNRPQANVGRRWARLLRRFLFCQSAVWLAVAWLGSSATFLHSAEARIPSQPIATLSASRTNAAAESPWKRVVMIGASASAGFTMFEPFGGTNTELLRLNRYLDAALEIPHQPIRNLANALFFQQPEERGPKQIEHALSDHPTLVIGADFLFWFCYGDGHSDAERLQRFENGLKMLEPIHCPLLLGDIPDASGAEGIMLSKDQIPSAKVREEANQRLKNWAASHPQVVILHLASFMKTAMANGALTIHGTTIPAGHTRSLLQFDKLHPTPQGCATLALAIVDALQSAKPEQFKGKVRWDPTEVLHFALSPPQSSAQSPASGARAAAPANSK